MHTYPSLVHLHDSFWFLRYAFFHAFHHFHKIIQLSIKNIALFHINMLISQHFSTFNLDLQRTCFERKSCYFTILYLSLEGPCFEPISFAFFHFRTHLIISQKSTLPTLRMTEIPPTLTNRAKTCWKGAGGCTLQIASHTSVRLLTHETARGSHSDDNARNTTCTLCARRIASTCSRIIDRYVISESFRQNVSPEGGPFIQGEGAPWMTEAGTGWDSSGPTLDCGQ